ncbi:MAG TPA: deaminase [Patescibacteria group bacterium]|nr:deaminase [Patescibacteria group bacterium]
MTYDYDWSTLAFESKKPLRELKATFIAAPRQLSVKRFAELAKEFLPQGNIVLGLAKEDYVDGFSGHPQFRTLQATDVQAVIDKVNTSDLPQKIYILHYFQREAKFILEKLKFPRVVLINGSWRHAFHHSESYYVLANSGTNYQMVSPFSDETEAQAYETKWDQEIAALSPLKNIDKTKSYSDPEMIDLANEALKFSYDYIRQTGTVLAKQTDRGYKYLAHSFNRVVPYQTHAMHHGSVREANFSPANDLNHYDANHAEVELLIAAQKQGLPLKNTTLFIDLLPCPTCARMLSQTDISEFVYTIDHSEGYALKLLEKSGKTVRRLVQ